MTLKRGLEDPGPEQSPRTPVDDCISKHILAASDTPRQTEEVEPPPPMPDPNADVPFQSMRVEPLSMKITTTRKKVQMVYPVFLLTDPATNEAYDFASVLSGGTMKELSGPCVALYVGPKGAVIVKTMLRVHEYQEESEYIDFVNRNMDALTGCMVRARVAAPGRRVHKDNYKLEDLRPENYTVIIMRYGGRPMYHLRDRLRNQLPALRVTHAIFSIVKRLYKKGMAYVDMKLANVLFHHKDDMTVQLSLCDYGSIVRVGEDGAATYPPPETPWGYDVVGNERSVLYGMGILLASCMTTQEEENALRYILPHERYAQLGREFTREEGTKELETFQQELLKFMSANYPLVGKVMSVAWTHGATLDQLDSAYSEAISSLTQMPTPPPCKQRRCATS